MTGAKAGAAIKQARFVADLGTKADMRDAIRSVRTIKPEVVIYAAVREVLKAALRKAA